MLSQVQDISDETRDILGALSNQTARLGVSANEARLALRDLNQRRYTDIRTDFLSAAKFIVQELHSLSFDIHRLLFNNVDEDQWKQYLAGERNTFTRNPSAHERQIRSPSASRARMAADGETRKLCDENT